MFNYLVDEKRKKQSFFFVFHLRYFFSQDLSTCHKSNKFINNFKTKIWQKRNCKLYTTLLVWNEDWLGMFIYLVEEKRENQSFFFVFHLKYFLLSRLKYVS